MLRPYAATHGLYGTYRRTSSVAKNDDQVRRMAQRRFLRKVQFGCGTAVMVVIGSEMLYPTGL
jgi:hypothetical protein